MERTVPVTGSEEIVLYLQTIYSLLRTSTEVKIRTLEEVHTRTNSSLHTMAHANQPDFSALIYSWLRLPEVMGNVSSITLAQSISVYQQHGYENILKWQSVSARARRRTCYFDGKETLACIIASRSDIDDIIPALTALQIEWNKLHFMFAQLSDAEFSSLITCPTTEWETIHSMFVELSSEFERLQLIWQHNFIENLQNIRSKPLNLHVQLLSGSLTEYQRATRLWTNNILSTDPELEFNPVYFVSSNPHSMPNLLTGYALQKKEVLIKFLKDTKQNDLLQEWETLSADETTQNQGNFLYYVLKKYQQSDAGKKSQQEQISSEQACRIQRVSSESSFDIETQVIPIRDLCTVNFDPRIKLPDMGLLEKSNAYILNIDYPLGFAAYHILTKLAEKVGPILGIYIMGKAASLNGNIGDIILPTVVFDEHSHNTYMFRNSFCGADLIPYLQTGSVLDNQKAMTVLGTYLQNSKIMDIIYRESYTDIEMEAGPYLSAVYEMFRPKRHPINEIVSLHRVPFDLGMLHYVSDTPMSKGQNLGSGTLSYQGIEPTYATSIAILRRIFSKEIARLQAK
ncbi:MAG: hypothetical protein JEZ00_17560 [Anaerolineaceae bacterium]|nr:hypothetical protein [Anaerolineaceae bacterium]